MQNSLIKIVMALVIAAACFGLGRYTSPKKTVTIEKEAKSVDLTVTEREVVQKDGTIIKEVIKTNVVTVEKEKFKSVENKKPQWRISGLSDVKAQTFGVSVERRVVGNIFGGVQYFDKQVALSVGMEF